MKRLYLFLLAAFAVISFTSCGNDSLTPKTEKISGPLGKYFKVVDRNYKAINGKVNVEIQRTEDGLPKPWKKEYGTKFGWNPGQVEPRLKIEYFDKDGNVVFKSKTLDHGSSHFLEDQDALQMMVSLSAGESWSITFDLNSNAAVNFALSSSFEYHPRSDVYNKDMPSEVELDGSNTKDENTGDASDIILNDNRPKNVHDSYVDLGLQSGTLWRNTNENGLYTYDDAVKNWSGLLPTKEQYQELINYCTWTWTGNGYKVTGNNGKFIFLPAEGWCDAKGKVSLVGTDGGYWSSTANGSDNAWYLNFNSKKIQTTNYLRNSGLSVRCVMSRN